MSSIQSRLNWSHYYFKNGTFYQCNPEKEKKKENEKKIMRGNATWYWFCQRVMRFSFFLENEENITRLFYSFFTFSPRGYLDTFFSKSLSHCWFRNCCWKLKDVYKICLFFKQVSLLTTFLDLLLLFFFFSFFCYCW